MDSTKPSDVACPICGGEVMFQCFYKRYFIVCGRCNIKFTTASHMSRSAEQLAEVIKKSKPISELEMFRLSLEDFEGHE